MPYFVFQDESQFDNFFGLAFTMGWMPDINDFQIALTIGRWTVAVGVDFSYWG